MVVDDDRWWWLKVKVKVVFKVKVVLKVNGMV